MTPEPSAPIDVPIAVVGGGLTGMAAALAFARSGIRTALILRGGAPPADLRTTALFPASVRLLRNLGVWPHCAGEAAALVAIRIVDDTDWLLRAPETVFHATDLGEAALAWNISNVSLARSMDAELAKTDAVSQFITAATPGYSRNGNNLQITLAEGQTITARLAVAADGRQSPLRSYAGIAAKRKLLDQTAVVATFQHSRPHGNVSTEMHGNAGPLTTVPLPGDQSSLVWVERPREAARLLALPPQAFLDALHARLHGLLGRLSGLTPRMSFDLLDLKTDAFAKGRIALVGEAAHVLPPIGAQGLNLGLRDVADLAEVVLAADRSGGDPGTGEILASYDRVRQRDNLLRTGTVSILNRSLVSGTFPLQLARGLGLHVINAIPQLKRALMHQGAFGNGPLPRLMQEPDQQTLGPG